MAESNLDLELVSMLREEHGRKFGGGNDIQATETVKKRKLANTESKSSHKHFSDNRRKRRVIRKFRSVFFSLPSFRLL